MSHTTIIRALYREKNADKARVLSRFFKTGVGEYAAGDRFIGVNVPTQRSIARTYRDTSLSDVLTLLTHPVHECRLTALFILVSQFERGDEKKRTQIYQKYLKHTQYINNWDLVDSSAYHIVGAYLLNHPTEKRKLLSRLARSKSLWERRIAIVSTFAMIREHYYDDTLTLAKILRDDTHDLIHKAVGWMLREVGKRDHDTLITFLTIHHHTLPRTTLRYAIERLSDQEKAQFMQRK